MKVKMQLPTPAKLIQSKGLAADGDVQMFHTQNVLKRIKKYMPHRTGGTYKITVAQTDSEGKSEFGHWRDDGGILRAFRGEKCLGYICH